jgi:hypothetical protein
VTRATAIAIVSLPAASRAFLRSLLLRGSRWSAEGGKAAIAEAWAHYAANENGRELAASAHADLHGSWMRKARERRDQSSSQSNKNRVG